MEPIRLNTQEALLYIALINAGIGALLGLIPLITGIVKRKISYGIYGFFASVLGGALLGLILSIPAAAIFTWLVVRVPKPSDTHAHN